MKVLIYGLPKSGTTILHQRMLGAMEARYGRVVSAFEPYERVHRADGEVELIKWQALPIIEGPATLAKALYSERSSTAHIRSDRVAEMFEDYDRKIFIQRDPRDQLISQFFYRWYVLARLFPTQFEDCLRAVRDKERAPSSVAFVALCRSSRVFHPSWMMHLPQPIVRAVLPVCSRLWASRTKRFLCALRDFLERIQAAGWHVLRYEDLVEGRLTDLQDHLGFELAAAASGRTSKTLKRVSRSDGHGSWRRCFTAEDLEFFRPIYGSALAGLGYDAEDWALDPQPSLLAAEGSDYLLQLRGS